MAVKLLQDGEHMAVHSDLWGRSAAGHDQVLISAKNVSR